MKLLSLILALLLILPVPVSALELSAKSAILMDVATGTVLYEENPHERLSPASVTKIMTMLLILEAVDAGQIRLTDTVTASETAAAKGGSQVYLKVGETMSVSDMLKSIAVSSANDCACAMAEHLAGSESAFVEKMNRRAEELGMNDTHFVNCTGLDDSPEAETHKTSAHDIALMSRQLLKYHPKIKEFTTIWMDTIRNGTFGLSNTNKLVRFYPGATGLKTGYTSRAGYCLSAAAERDDLELIAVVMGSRTSGERNEACKQLLDLGFSQYALIEPDLTEADTTVPVKLGKQPCTTARLGGSTELLIEKEKSRTVTTQIDLPGSLTAPIAQGQQVGTLTISSGEEILAKVPLVSAAEVPRLTWLQIFTRILRQCAMGK